MTLETLEGCPKLKISLATRFPEKFIKVRVPRVPRMKKGGGYARKSRRTNNQAC